MWSAFMNGAGLQGGGGGGFVQSQGWEFVPRSRIEKADRGRGKNRSPLRRISSPPTVFSHIQEPPIGASQTAGEGGAGTQTLEVLRGQMWPGPEPQQQQQMQQMRLKKKLEDLKKRHVQDKEEWMREKESLLRQVADIQGGENRRILLDLKTVLEEVQAEVKKEEEKRSDLQLQYTRDRCAWELEKAELKCRIAQLETREARGLGSGGFQSAAGLGSVTSRSPRESNSETSTLRREREEQRRILADTHSTAMDLRCRLDHNERDWLREKAELLERFDVERREWECQLKDMQKKIEELYCEVRSSRGGPALDSMKQDDDAVHRLSMRSTSTGSSLLSDNSRSDLLSSSTPSEPTRNPPSPGLGLNRNIRADGDSPCGFNVDVRFSQSDPLQPELLVETRSREPWKQNSSGDNKKAGGTAQLEDFHCGAPDSGTPQEYVSIGNDKSLQGIPLESPLWARLSYGSDKKKNTTALNAALKEIARVSEELCSYQDEIRKKSGDKRNQSESLCPSEGCEKNFLQVEEAPCDLSQIYDDLRALQQENWIALSPESTWRANRSSSDTWTANTSDQTSPGESSEMETAAPPIPPRTSSWNLNSSTPDTELHIPESPMATMRKCHSPCVLLDRKCNSPSIVRKFEAMLQENEGKVFKDGMLTSCSIPSNSNCNTGCCHNRWSCDASKLAHNKQLTYGTVQKSFSEVNILTAGKDLCPEKNSDVGKVQVFPVIQEFPVDSVSQGIQSLSPSLQGSRRNLMLERKTAEFNRTLFQAEMGRGVDVQETCFEACQPVFGTPSHILPPKDASTPSMCSDVSTDITDSDFKVSLLPSFSTSTKQNTESEPVQIGCASKETPSVSSLEEPHPGLKEAPKPSQSAVKHKLQKKGSFSRKSQQRATHEPPSSVITQPDESVENSNSNRENPHETKPQPARGSVSPLQPSVESKKRHMAQPRQRSDSPHQPDSSRPVHRIMNEHPWKPLTLAAYPRPEGSRSNYGAVERILKNYESAARAQQNEMVSNPTELDMLDMAPLPLSPTLRHKHTSATAQVSLHSVNEMQLKVQEDEESSVTPPSVHKSFLRPARPANRRLPSRWASRSPTSSSSPSSSPCTTPVVPASFPLQKHSSSFTYTHGFHIETVII
ncbi:protein SOGA3a [Gambusia affinis]|uniref:protein SOGA3a n=1 Tax=Gambusia affinis TaxID=33528 RepID=UPI001CDC0CCB|nr:protein SOGA3a [Gambusia affinis]